MNRILACIAILLALAGKADSGLTTKMRAPGVLNGFLLSGWCNDLPFRDEEGQQRATYYQAYSDGMCTMFVSFGLELTRSDGSLPAHYCLPDDVKYTDVAQEFGLYLRRNPTARESDPLDALITLLEAEYPCNAK